MKRTDLLRHLRRTGCVFHREGSRHSIWLNLANQKIAAVPRHNEIKDLTARKICKELEVPEL
jgi:hypothetical protein